MCTFICRGCNKDADVEENSRGFPLKLCNGCYGDVPKKEVPAIEVPLMITIEHEVGQRSMSG